MAGQGAPGLGQLCFLPEMQTRPRQGERSASSPPSEGLWANHNVPAWPSHTTALALVPKGSRTTHRPARAAQPGGHCRAEGLSCRLNPGGAGAQ